MNRNRKIEKCYKDLQNIKDVLKALLVLDFIVFVSGVHYFLAPIALLNATMFSIGLLRGMDIYDKIKKLSH